MLTMEVMMMMGMMQMLMNDAMHTFFWPHRTCFHTVSVCFFHCVIIFGLPVAFGAVSFCKSSGSSFSRCKCAASAFSSGYKGVDLARKFSASISLAQAQFFSFFFHLLPSSPFLPCPSLAVFICFVEKGCGNFGRRFLRPGKVMGLLLRMIGVSLLPGGGKRTGGKRTAFPAPRQGEGVVLQ